MPEWWTDFWCFARRWEDSLPGAPLSVVGSDVNEDDALGSRGAREREPVAPGEVNSVGGPSRLKRTVSGDAARMVPLAEVPVLVHEGHNFKLHPSPMDTVRLQRGCLTCLSSHTKAHDLPAS